jgi:O-antigen ligase
MGLLISGSGVSSAENLRTGWLLAALLTSQIGLLQYFGLAPELAPWINTAQIGEAFGNLRQKNQFASLMSIGLLALLCGAGARWPRVQVLGMMVLAVGSAASASRTGLLQLCFIALCVGVWALPARSARLRLVILALLAYAVAAWLLPLALFAATGVVANGIAGRLTMELGCSSRTVLWANVLDLIAPKPWLGWGVGELDYAHFTNLYAGERFCDILDNAHNLPLHLAVELGVPFALLVCGGFAWWVWRQRPWAEVDPTRQLAWGVMGLILLHSMVEYPLWYGPFFMSFVLCLWMLHSTPRAEEQMQNRLLAGEKYARLAPKIVAIVLLCVTAYVAWDYHRISQIYLQPEERSAAYRDNTLEKVRPSWLFAPQVRFAEVVLTPVDKSNAAYMRELTEQTLHYSPEPRVIEKRIEAASLLGLDDEALFYALRYKIAFAQDYAKWVEGNAALAAKLQRPAESASN